MLNLGGELAGSYCAQTFEKALRRLDVEVVVIHRNNDFVSYPLLGSTLEPGDGREGTWIPCQLVIQAEDWTDLTIRRSLNRGKVTDPGARISQMTKRPLT
jgi:hypothetical protein